MPHFIVKFLSFFKHVPRRVQRPNAMKCYVKSVLNGFLYVPLEACLVNLLELPLKLFICLDVLGHSY